MPKGFVAPPVVRDALQQTLVNLIDLAVSGKQAHWNVIGPNFRSLHLAFDEVVEVARAGIDEIAERMRAVGTEPDGRAATVVESSELPKFPKSEIASERAAELVVKAINAVTGQMRKVFDDVDEADPTSADILNAYIGQLEQQAWFIDSTLREDK